MAYTKIVPIKTGTHLEQAIRYILNPDKTEEMQYVYAFMCDTDTAAKDFKAIYDKAIHKGNNIAHQITVSFSPEDNITSEQALELCRKLMEHIYPNNQYVLAIHSDREHLHGHIIVNAVDFVKYKKIHSNKRSLREMRDICDKMCEELGLSVIEKETKQHRKRLISAIDEVIGKSSDFDDFIVNMQSIGYEIKMDKYLYFKGKNERNFRRSDTMGDAYSVIGVNQILPKEQIIISYWTKNIENMGNNAVSDSVFNKSSMSKMLAFISFKSNITQSHNVVCPHIIIV